MDKCISCNERASTSVKFPCPQCKKQIKRCHKCRNLSIDYKCNCGYQGP